MTFDVSELNIKYRNLSETTYSESAWTIVRVADSEAQRAYESLLKCWNERFLGYDHFAELRSVLRDAYVALRSAVGRVSGMNQYLRELGVELQTAIHNAKNFLSEIESRLLSQASEDFDIYSNKADFPLANVLLNEASANLGKTTIVVNGSDFLDLASELEESLRVFPSISRALANINYREQNHIIMVAAPDQNIPIHQLRLLLVGGFTVKVTFIVPSWWAKRSAQYLNSNLWFGLDGDGADYIREAGATHTSVEEDLPDSTANWDFSVPPRPLSKRVEKYVNAGPIECKLFSLKQSLVMPIEKEATRVAVIIQNVNGIGYSLDYVSPLTAAQRNDVVFSFAQVSERSFIREQADKQLGDELFSIQELQELWKSKLNERAAHFGWNILTEQLSTAGVSKAHRVKWWAQDPNFIRPQADYDFEQLLSYLGFQNDYVALAFAATRKINRARDIAGTVARKALADAVTDEVWASLQAGFAAEISLNDVGEASFIASKVEALEPETIFSGVLQVRRILGVK